MARTYEEIEKDILKIRKDIVLAIREGIEEKGYGVDDTISGELVDVKVDRDWDHILVYDVLDHILECDVYDSNRRNYGTWCHIDYCSVDTLLEAYRTVLRARPNFLYK